MIGSFGRALRKRAVLCSLGILSVCLLVAGCSQNFRQIALPLPTQTGDPAPLDRALFLATAGGTQPGSVTMVDVPGDTNVGVEQMGVDPVMIGLTFGGGRAVVPNSVDNTASSFQTGVPFGTVSTTTLPPSSGASFVHSRQNGKFYIALTSLGTLGVVDFTLSVIKQVPLTSCSPTAISQVPGGGNVYVGCSDGTVSVVTPSDNIEVDHISSVAGGSIAWMDTSFDGKYTFVADSSGNVEVICSTTDTTVCTGDMKLATTGLPGAPSFLKYDTHSAHVLVAGAGFVSILDASGTTPTFADIKDLPGSGQTWVTALADGSRIYVSNSGNDSIDVYAASNFVKLKTIVLPAIAPETGPVQPIMIDSDKNSTKVYTANAGTRDFTVLRTIDDTEVLPETTSAGAAGRLLPPTISGCTVAPLALPSTCRQTPNWVTVLP